MIKGDHFQVITFLILYYYMIAMSDMYFIMVSRIDEGLVFLSFHFLLGVVHGDIRTLDNIINAVVALLVYGHTVCDGYLFLGGAVAGHELLHF